MCQLSDQVVLFGDKHGSNDEICCFFLFQIYVTITLAEKTSEPSESGAQEDGKLNRRSKRTWNVNDPPSTRYPESTAPRRTDYTTPSYSYPTTPGRTDYTTPRDSYPTTHGTTDYTYPTYSTTHYPYDTTTKYYPWHTTQSPSGSTTEYPWWVSSTPSHPTTTDDDYTWGTTTEESPTPPSPPESTTITKITRTTKFETITLIGGPKNEFHAYLLSEKGKDDKPCDKN